MLELLLGVHIAVALLGGPRAVGPLLVAVLAQELLILLHNQNAVLHLKELSHEMDMAFEDTMLTNVDRLTACFALRELGAVLTVFLRR